LEFVDSCIRDALIEAYEVRLVMVETVDYVALEN
jgi:hypothetical protein